MTRELDSVQQIDEIVAESARHAVVIFKHSTTCGTSAFAHEEILDLIQAGDGPPSVYVVNVRAHRDVSNAIAARFNIRHESPQALLLQSGRVVWSASHFRVTAKAIAAKLQELGNVLAGK